MIYYKLEGTVKMRKALRNIDKPLLLVTVLLFAIGLIMIFSASNVTAFMTKAESPYFYFLKQGFFLITGIFFIALPILRCPTKAYSKLSKLLMLIFTGLLVYVLAFSESVNQAKVLPTSIDTQASRANALIRSARLVLLVFVILK